MTTETMCDHERDYSWIEYDARGIYLARVCERCVDSVLSKYRPDVLTDPNYYTDEPIEPED